MAAAARPAAVAARPARAKSPKPAPGNKRAAATAATSVNGRLWAGGWQD